MKVGFGEGVVEGESGGRMGCCDHSDDDIKGRIRRTAGFGLRDQFVQESV